MSLAGHTGSGRHLRRISRQLHKEYVRNRRLRPASLATRLGRLARGAGLPRLGCQHFRHGHLARRVEELEVLQQVPAVGLQGPPIGPD
jgi:hypothetical protein